MDIFLGAAAFLIGAVIAAGNYGISRAMLRRFPGSLAPVFMLRQTVNVIFLAVLFLVGSRTGGNVWALLIGGALGVTLPALFFTAKLLKTAANTNTGKENADG